MNRAAFLAITLLLLAAMPVLIRCETTILNEQVTLDGRTGNIVKEYYWSSLTNGDTISITLDVSR